MIVPGLFLVLARAANGVIGRDGDLPWRLPADMKRFRALTMGRPMIMGRRTFESLPGLLPGRRHIVMTRDGNWSAPGAERAGDAEAALALASTPAGTDEVAVIGGAAVFASFLPLADRIELTEVLADVPGDTLAPAIDEAGWRETFREDHDAQDGRDAHVGRPGFRFRTLLRA